MAAVLAMLPRFGDRERPASCIGNDVDLTGMPGFGAFWTLLRMARGGQDRHLALLPDCYLTASGLPPAPSSPPPRHAPLPDFLPCRLRQACPRPASALPHLPMSRLRPGDGCRHNPATTSDETATCGKTGGRVSFHGAFLKDIDR